MDKRLVKIAVALVCCAVVQPVAGVCAPSVSSVRLSGESVPLYDVLTIDFQVATDAANPFWPYDPAPPPSIPPGVGVSVDGLFSDDNWLTTITVPGFVYQDYERRVVGAGQGPGDEAFVPVGNPRWRVRFAPKRVANWRARLRVTDASGTATHPGSGDLTFRCVQSQSGGFVKVSSRDPRYFELSDGTPLLGPGVNIGFNDSTLDAASTLKTLGTNSVRIARWWMTYRGWPNPFGGGDYATSGGPQWSFSLKMSADGGHKTGDRYSALVAPGKNTKQTVYLIGGQNYRFSGYMRTDQVAGAAGKGAQPYLGFVNGAIVTGTTEWRSFSVDSAPASSGAYTFGVKNTGSSGNAYFDDVTLRSTGDGGLTWSGEWLSKGDFDFQNYTDPRECYAADLVFQEARSNGVYLKTVITEKQDRSLGSIMLDGTTGTRSDDNFYAADGSPSRWLQTAWWRYIIARWGAYTSVHSWELCNEGDPFNGNHRNAANALASYFHANDPNKGLCTTSFWHSVPMDFWKNSTCDYLDVHQYVGGTTANGVTLVYAWSDPPKPISLSNVLLPRDQTSQMVSYDTPAHAGARSVRIIAKSRQEYDAKGVTSGLQECHFGIDPSHRYTLTFWGKAEDVGTGGSGLQWQRPGAVIAWSRAYHENDYISETRVDADLGTYDWKQFTGSGIAPPADANTANITFRCTQKPDTRGTFWVDDIVLTDETTGKSLYTDGSFEEERMDHDTALAVRRLGLLYGSYSTRARKPVVGGETGIFADMLYGQTYKGYSYTSENQQLVDDVGGVYLRKLIWAHVLPDNPCLLYWWTNLIRGYGLWGYFGAFQAFMRGIPLSNGHYQDVSASVSNPGLRVWGQKDLTNNRAHVWIDNRRHTWKNVVDGVTIPAESGQITISGFRDGPYKAQWWNTSTGTVTRTEDVICSGGSIALSVTNLGSDTACKVFAPESVVQIRVFLPEHGAPAGEEVTVTVQYTNSGLQGAENTLIRARVPAGTDYVSGSAEATGGAYDPQTQTLSWNVGAVGAGQTGTKTFKVRIGS